MDAMSNRPCVKLMQVIAGQIQVFQLARSVEDFEAVAATLSKLRRDFRAASRLKQLFQTAVKQAFNHGEHCTA
jgi:hypothetical protein